MPPQKPDEKLPELAPFELGVAGGSGAKPELVTRDSIDEHNPSISPDDRVLLFNAVAYKPYYIRERYFRGYYRGTPLYGYRRVWKKRLEDVTIVGVDPRTGASRTLYTATGTHSWSPAWLPDGSAFVYASNRPGARSLVRALSSSPNAAITVVVAGQVAPSVLSPHVAPKGRRVAFQTLIRGEWQIGVTNMDGSRFTMLGRGQSPAWSPDGSKIAFTRVDNGYSHVFIANADSGSNIVQVTSGQDDDYTPRFSPDGARLVFASNRGWQSLRGTRKGTRNLYVISVDGSNLTQLTTGSGKTYQPDWSRSGWIYFSSAARGNFDIWRMQAPTT